MGYEVKSMNYHIHDIRGEDNVWADLISRWRPSQTLKICRIRFPQGVVRPLQDDEFVWPTIQEIKEIQQEHKLKLGRE